MKNKDKTAAGLKLSRRLATLADWVPDGARVADIGTDHALLPVYMAGQGKVSFAVAGDVHEGPIEAARRQVAEAGLMHVISVRHGDGMNVLDPGEVDTVVIAGMGGSLMVRILDEAEERLNGVDTLVLSPHVAEDAVRRWLAGHQYVLDRELLLEEDGVIYTLIRAVREKDKAEFVRRQHLLFDPELLSPRMSKVPHHLLVEMGPLLLRQPDAIFHRKWGQELTKRERVIEQLGYATAPGAAEKAVEWKQDVREIREVLACLPEEN